MIFGNLELTHECKDSEGCPANIGRCIAIYFDVYVMHILYLLKYNSNKFYSQMKFNALQDQPLQWKVKGIILNEK